VILSIVDIALLYLLSTDVPPPRNIKWVYLLLSNNLMSIKEANVSAIATNEALIHPI
jgi:hypothetical protein